MLAPGASFFIYPNNLPNSFLAPEMSSFLRFLIISFSFTRKSSAFPSRSSADSSVSVQN